ncbi:MAG: hypothetical protein HMLKMBBP_03504 [Planctomycetes bacterium]|nr:hypothetical protein [Planctomycetota bacterium]
MGRIFRTIAAAAAVAASACSPGPQAGQGTGGQGGMAARGRPAADVAADVAEPSGGAPAEAAGLAATAVGAPSRFTWPDRAAADVAFKWSVKRRVGGAAEPRCRWFWYMWRSERRVETLESHGNSGEAWIRDSSGAITGYERHFHVERKTIEYVPGDLAAVGTSADWTRLASVVDPSALGRGLVLSGRAEFGGEPVEVWSGESGGVALEVGWCPGRQLPVRITRTKGEESLEMELRDARQASGAPWSRPKSDRYERTDFADIGDRTTDPFFRRLIASGGVLGSICSH